MTSNCPGMVKFRPCRFQVSSLRPRFVKSTNLKLETLNLTLHPQTPATVHQHPKLSGKAADSAKMFDRTFSFANADPGPPKLLDRSCCESNVPVPASD